VCAHDGAQANDRGYECVVLKDCVASYFPEFQRVGLEMIKAQGAIFGWVSIPKASSRRPPMSTSSRHYPNLYKDSVSLMADGSGHRTGRHRGRLGGDGIGHQRRESCGR
jgi:hypothetical protein